MAPRYACEQLCAPADVETVGSCRIEGIDEDDINSAIDSASDALIEMTQRTLGRCTEVLRPCRNACAPRPCGCCVTRGIQINGVQPTITKILIDGVEVTDGFAILTRPSGLRFLERFNPDGTPLTWPGCQNLLLPSTDEGTFEVTYTHGEGSDMLTRWAAAEIAADLLAPFFIAAEQRLDDSVDRVSAYGMDMSMSQNVSGEEGRDLDRLAGLGHVKRFLAVYPPLTAGSDIWAPELDDGWKHFVRG